jgi:hypothetical protein
MEAESTKPKFVLFYNLLIYDVILKGYRTECPLGEYYIEVFNTMGIKLDEFTLYDPKNPVINSSKLEEWASPTEANSIIAVLSTYWL